MNNFLLIAEARETQNNFINFHSRIISTRMADHDARDAIN